MAEGGEGDTALSGRIMPFVEGLARGYIRVCHQAQRAEAAEMAKRLAEVILLCRLPSVLVWSMELVLMRARVYPLHSLPTHRSGGARGIRGW